MKTKVFINIFLLNFMLMEYEFVGSIICGSDELFAVSVMAEGKFEHDESIWAATQN